MAFCLILAGIACTLQYAALKPLRRAAFTAAGALAVLAFWAQVIFFCKSVLTMDS